MIKKAIDYHFKKIKRYFEENTASRIVVAGLMVTAVGLLSFGVFLLARAGLESTQEGTDVFITEAVPLYIYQIFLLVTGFLIFLSTIIFALFNFFKGDDDAWIMVSPRYDSLSWINLIRALIDSSWPIVVLAIPLLLAVQSVFALHPLFWLIALFAVTIFSLSCGAIAIVSIFAIATLMSLLKLKSFVLLSFVMLLVSLSLGGIVWSSSVNVNLENIFQVEEIARPTLSLMQDNFTVLPSHFPAMTIHYLQQDELNEALYEVGAITVFFLLLIISFGLLRIRFLRLWQSFQEGSFEARTKRKRRDPLFLRVLPVSSEDVIFKKELLTGIRSPRNFFWFVFLMILLFIQVGLVNLLGKYMELGNSEEMAFTGTTPFLQIGIILFLVSSFVLRFVFPSFSQEGETSWIIGSAPINLKSVFLAKNRFYGLLLVSVGVVALSIYLLAFSIPNMLMAGLIAMAVIGVVTLTMLGLSLGTIFPNFTTNDPQKLSTSAPGIAFTLMALSYSIIGAYLLYSSFIIVSYVPFLIFLVISFTIYETFSYLALRSLERMEFL